MNEQWVGPWFDFLWQFPVSSFFWICAVALTIGSLALGVLVGRIASKDLGGITPSRVVAKVEDHDAVVFNDTQAWMKPVMFVWSFAWSLMLLFLGLIYQWQLLGEVTIIWAGLIFVLSGLVGSLSFAGMDFVAVNTTG